MTDPTTANAAGETTCSCCATPAETTIAADTSSSSTESVTISSYTVNGMTCAHCVASVTEEITEIDGVTAVEVDLPTGAVTVTSIRPVDDADIQAAVTEAGYQLPG